MNGTRPRTGIRQRPPREVETKALFMCACGAPLPVRVRVVLQSIRAAAKHAPVTKLLVLCAACRRMFVVALPVSSR
jgi:hypothetical protein